MLKSRHEILVER